jgi:hypothetical protein
LPLMSEEPRTGHELLPALSLRLPFLPLFIFFSILPPRPALPRAPFFSRPRSAPRLNELIDGVALFVEANGHNTRGARARANICSGIADVISFGPRLSGSLTGVFDIGE